MRIKKGDVIRLCFVTGDFEIAEIWSDKELLAVGGLIVQISDVVSVVERRTL